MQSLLNKVINRYNSEKFLGEINYIEAEVSASGLAFLLKRQPSFKKAKLSINTIKPYSKITPIGTNQNITAVLGGKHVWLEDQYGMVLRKRDNARSYFSSFERKFSWDDLDMAYFANYAFWNYFTFPILLINPHVQWKQIDNNTLEATFFDEIPTHSKIQRFHFDDEGYLLRHDYRADVITKFATASNHITEHMEIDGFLFPSKRVVTPRLGKKVLSKPVLINIDVHNINILYK